MYVTLKLLEESDITHILTWVKKPHVALWWSAEATMSTQDLQKKYLRKIDSKHQKAFIILVGGHPIGYLQCYDAAATTTTWLPQQPAGTWGIDQFIGEADYIGKGYGTAMIKQCITMLFEKPEITRIIVDPDSENSRAIRCYKGVGFKKVKLIKTLDGIIMLMALKRRKPWEKSYFLS